MGKLKLPPLLEQRRKEFGIEDGCFRTHALFDRCFVWQIPVDEKIAGSTLIKSERTKSREKVQAPRGILISAGLQSLDYLVSHGCRGVGEEVEFVRLSPWRKPVDTVDGREIELVVCRATDIVGSQWLAHALYVTGEAEIIEENGRHRIRIGDVTYEPATPETADDY